MKRIYLDLDDTLNLMCPYIVSTFGERLPQWDYSLNRSYDIWDDVRFYLQEQGKVLPSSGGDPWNLMNKFHWAAIPKAPYCDWLLETCCELASEVYILTRPTGHADCYAGKFAWVQRQLSREWHSRLIIATFKNVCCGPNTLLIDDSQENIAQWLKGGGSAITVPRPWNHMHHETNFAEEHIASALSVQTDKSILLQRPVGRVTRKVRAGQ